MQIFAGLGSDLLFSKQKSSYFVRLKFGCLPLDCRWSLAIAAVAVLWLLAETTFFMLPTVYPLNALTFNYAPVAVGSALVLVLSSWLVSARLWFFGPKVDIDNSDAVLIQSWVSDPPRSAH